MKLFEVTNTNWENLQIATHKSALQWHRRDLDPMEAGISERSWTIHTKVNTEIPQSHPIRTLVFQVAQAAKLNPSEKPALQKSPRFRKLWPLETYCLERNKTTAAIKFIFVLRKKGSKTKERMKEEEIEKGDCGPPTRKVFFWFCRTWVRGWSGGVSG